MILKRTLSVALCVSIVGAAQLVSLAAATRNDSYTDVFADDFESYATGAVSSELMPNWYIKDDIANCKIEEEAGNKLLQICNTTGAPVFAMKQNTTEKIQRTPVQIKFDVKIPATDDEVWGLVCPVMEESSNIADTNFGQNQMLHIRKSAGADDTRIEFKDGADVVKTISISTEKWYTVQIEENLGGVGNWSFVASVYDKSTGNLVGNAYKLSSIYMGTFQNINFTAWRTGAYYVDNIDIDKVARGIVLTDDMEYSSREEASKYWRINGDNAYFTQIDEAHGISAAVGNAEFHPCIAADAVESGKVNIDFDTYIQENTNGTAVNCGRVNVLDKDGISNPGGNCILKFETRTDNGNVDLYVGDNWINQLQPGWYHINIELDLDAGSYSVSAKNRNGNDYCSTNPNSKNNTTRAITNFALVNFTSWSEDFIFDNLNIVIGDKTEAEFNTENSVQAKYISDNNKATAITTTVTNTGDSFGSFVTIVWNISSNGESGTITAIKEGGSKTGNSFSLAPGASIEFGMIIDGLYDIAPEITVNID